MTGVRITGTPLGWVAVVALMGTGLPAQAQTHLRNSAGVIGAFKNVVAKPSDSTVRVLCEDKEVALGTIVAADGWIVTKASELKGKIVCKLKNGKSFEAKLRGVEEKHDLAMLKIDAQGLKPIEWRDSTSAEVGNWVASAGVGTEPVAVGVVSVATRRPRAIDMPMTPPPANSGYLGIGLEEGDGAPKIGTVAPGSAAEKAGLKVGDIVLAVAGRKVLTPERLVAAIQAFKAGDSLTLQIKRGEEVKDVTATLDKRPTTPGFNRADFQNNLGSQLSRKRGGFPIILQHDTVIKPTDCGGPLVDLDGKAVGINIARAGRTESYAIPAETVMALIKDLQSGKLAPTADHPGSPLAEMQKTLEKIRGDLKRAEESLDKVEKERQNAEARKKDLEKQLAELRKRLADAQSALEKARNKDRK